MRARAYRLRDLQKERKKNTEAEGEGDRETKELED
jgi:hypothetical protein